MILDLVLAFLQVGAFSIGGGYAAMPLIKALTVDTHAWLTATEFADLVTIAEMTPGPIALNAATFVGMRVAGVPGALMAVLGVLMPSFTIAVAAGFFLAKFKDRHYLNAALTGIRPASIGMVISVIISMGMQNYVAWQPIVIGIIAFIMLWKFKLSVPWIVLASAAMGMVLIR